jgi:Fe2+ transport system protein B
MKERVIKTIKGALPQTTKTCLWIIKITLGVSFAMMLLKYLDVLPWIADLLDPLFKYVGLPGECALAFVSGYFVNVYSAVAVISTLNLDVRALTILGAMILCSHSMILETAVLKKTGANPVRMVIIRTIGSILIGIALNLIMPASDVVLEHNSVVVENISFGAAL